MKIQFFFLLIIGVLFVACSKQKANSVSDNYPEIFPDYISITVPYNIAPLDFRIDGAQSINAEFSVEGQKLSEITGRNLIRIPEKKWAGWLEKYKGKELIMTVSVWTDTVPGGIKYKPFSMKISKVPIDEWIAYRLIEPGYELWNQMGIYQRNLSSFDETAIVTNKQNHNGCVNCHSFNNYSPSTFMFHSRGKNGTTVLVENGEPRSVDFSKITDMNATYPMWHPSGNYIVYASGVTRQSFYISGKKPVEVYDLESNLIIYDIRNNKVLTDERLTTKDRFETFPAFSPDGKFLYYCCANAEKMPMEMESLKYAICRVPFNEETGKLGNRIDTLYNPDVFGGSASFPRISPDNKYLLYTESAYGTFPIWHDEADLKMIDLKTLKQLDTSPVNSTKTESYHSWSSNGKWIIFSSRRIDGRYTRLYIAELNDDGSFEKPFLLPQKDPFENTTRMKSYNIPEFIQGKVELNKEDVASMFN
jgi:dipeptidyl aminopeptidase/acylaminoacyl peptidase